MKLILASESEARKRLLKKLRLPFITVSANVDEEPFKKKISNPRKLAQSLARLKAQSVADLPAYRGCVVIGSDQVVVCSSKIYGKPGSQAGAEKQLREFSGKTIRLLTAVCVIDSKGREKEFVDLTKMKVRKLSSREIASYVKLDAPIHCAGSFKFESFGIALFDTIATSDPTAIEGLPVLRLARELRSIYKKRMIT